MVLVDVPTSSRSKKTICWFLLVIGFLFAGFLKYIGRPVACGLGAEFVVNFKESNANLIYADWCQT